MCSIFGIGFLRGHKFRNKSTVTGVVSRLFKEAESGGRKAAGVSIMNEKSVNVLRRPMSGSQLVGTEEYLGFMQERLEFEKAGRYTMSIIGHCRWPTQGSPSNNLNNHPLVIDNIIGVHNGVITNDYNLFKEFRTLKRLAEVDTEIIF
ncbi:MAG: hypothetical protein R3356_02775, partial [Eudoraea sp.]|nr:hypothetical protein [Eudoraea sp.]